MLSIFLFSLTWKQHRQHKSLCLRGLWKLVSWVLTPGLPLSCMALRGHVASQPQYPVYKMNRLFPLTSEACCED